MRAPWLRAGTSTSAGSTARPSAWAWTVSGSEILPLTRSAIAIAVLLSAPEGRLNAKGGTPAWAPTRQVLRGAQSPAAIATADQANVIWLRHPRARYDVSLIGFTRHNSAVGTVVTKRTVYSTPSGVYTGEVRLLSTATPGSFEFKPGAGTLVGRFKVRVPYTTD